LVQTVWDPTQQHHTTGGRAYFTRSSCLHEFANIESM
jgi:hypothetical protein